MYLYDETSFHEKLRLVKFLSSSLLYNLTQCLTRNQEQGNAHLLNIIQPPCVQLTHQTILFTHFMHKVAKFYVASIHSTCIVSLSSYTKNFYNNHRSLKTFPVFQSKFFLCLLYTPKNRRHSGSK